LPKKVWERGRLGRGGPKRRFLGGIVKTKNARLERRGAYCQNDKGENWQDDKDGEIFFADCEKKVTNFAR
jgi:hypothetical protein